MGAVRQLRCVVCQTPYTGSERFCPIDGGAIVATTSADAADGYVGKTIDGRYLVRRLIGKGGMGAVYEADHVGLDRRVAIKLMLGRVDADALARFRREARAASKVVHANVVQIFDVGTDDDNLDYIVMEYIDGDNLHTAISAAPVSAGGGFSTARAVNIATQLVRGLGAIHAAGIVHRDIKPANVLLLDGDVVKLTDFGIAKSTNATSALTETGQVIGTVKYMAPEQLAGQPLDPRTDLYAAGLVLYEMLAGSAPFDSEASAELAAMHLSQAAPSIADVRADVSPELAAVIERALAKEPDDRFADADDLIEALAAAPVSDATPVPASPRNDAPTKAGKSARKNVAATARTKAEPVVEAPAKTANVAASKSALARYAPWAAVMIVVGVGLGLGIRQLTKTTTDQVSPQRGSAETLAPNEVEAEISKARTAEDDKNYDLAIAHYRVAYATDHRPALLYRIGDLQDRSGKKREAAETLREYVAASPDASDRATVEARIALLDPPADAAPVVENSGTDGADTRAKPAVRAKVAYVVKLTGTQVGCQCNPMQHGDSLVPLKPKSFKCHCSPTTDSGEYLCQNGVDPDQPWIECLGGASHAGTPGKACRGTRGRLANKQAGPMTDGVEVCSAEDDGLGYAGAEGDACTGFDRHEVNTKKTGVLYCQGDKQWMPPANLAWSQPTMIQQSPPSTTVASGKPKLAVVARFPENKKGCSCSPKSEANRAGVSLVPHKPRTFGCHCSPSLKDYAIRICTQGRSATDWCLDKIPFPGTPYAACHGEDESTGKPVDGIMICAANELRDIGYEGEDGDPCEGWDVYDFGKRQGWLYCKERTATKGTPVTAAFVNQGVNVPYPPPTAAPAPTKSTPLKGGDAVPDGKRACLCLPRDGVNGSTSLCPKLAQLRHCDCRSKDSGRLYASFDNDGAPDRAATGHNIAPSASYKDGGECHGRGTPALPEETGTLEDCYTECAVKSFTYVGQERQACVGYSTSSNELVEGSLDCSGATYKP